VRRVVETLEGVRAIMVRLRSETKPDKGSEKVTEQRDTPSPKQAGLIKVLESRGEKGFRILRTAEAPMTKYGSRRPGLRPAAPVK